MKQIMINVPATECTRSEFVMTGYVVDVQEKVIQLSSEPLNDPSKFSEYEIVHQGEALSLSTPLTFPVMGLAFQNNHLNMVSETDLVTIDGKQAYAIMSSDEAPYAREDLYHLMEVVYAPPFGEYVAILPTIHQSNQIVICSKGHRAYEADQPAQTYSDDVTLLSVGCYAILPAESLLRKRWWICKYPEGTWKNARRVLHSTGQFPNGLQWRLLYVSRYFDREYMPFSGYEFRIAVQIP